MNPTLIRPAGPPEDGVDRMTAAWLRERPGTPVTAMGLVTRLRWIAKLLEDDQRRMLSRLGIDVATRDLLSTLRRSGPPYRLTVGELTRQSWLTTGAISQRLARAEQQGFVQRSRDPDSARQVLVTLTPAGHHAIETTLDDLLGREHELLSGLTDQEQARLVALLRPLLADLLDRTGARDWPVDRTT
jgi:DNA-binding MarR family transcriptional regulator